MKNSSPYDFGSKVVLYLNYSLSTPAAANNTSPAGIIPVYTAAGMVPGTPVHQLPVAGLPQGSLAVGTAEPPDCSTWNEQYTLQNLLL